MELMKTFEANHVNLNDEPVRDIADEVEQMVDGEDTVERCEVDKGNYDNGNKKVGSKNKRKRTNTTKGKKRKGRPKKNKT
jgi:hypothetical protein